MISQDYSRMIVAVLLVEFLLVRSSYSFQHALRHPPFSIHRRYGNGSGGIAIDAIGSTILSAKSGGKKKKKRASPTAAGGGFGKASSPTKSESATATTLDDGSGDYDVFPPLEEGVRSTLQASGSDHDAVAGDLSGEMYDRLAQIYGFHRFNYPREEEDDSVRVVEEEEEVPATSFDDLFGGGGGDPSDFSSLLEPPPSSSVGATIDAMTPDGERLAFLQNLPPSSKIRVLHVDPMVLAVDDFFTDEECDRYVRLSTEEQTAADKDDAPQRVRSKTVGKDDLAKAQRTSTTWFHYFKVVPELMAKASRLLGLQGIERWEEPQTVRYQQSEKFTWHLDALPPTQTEPSMGGQRLVTLLVYLTDIGTNVGGATAFRDLGSSTHSNKNDDGRYLKMVPQKGSALVFFPAAGGIPGSPIDVRTLHAGEALGEGAKDDKWIAQLWLRERVGYVPNAPKGNFHRDAVGAVEGFCGR